MISMTAQVMKGDREKILAAGCGDYIAKPIDQHELVSQVRAALRIKKAEDALREERDSLKEEHRAILETAMDGFWILDAAGRFLEVNETYCEMSGYAEEELLHMDITVVEDVGTAANMAAHMQKVMAEGQDLFESRHRRKDGSVFDVEVSVQYRPLDEQQCVAFIRDITGRKRTMEALRESENQISSIFKSAPVGIGSVVNRVLNKVNDRLCEMTGYDESELIGQSARMLYPSYKDFEFVGREKYAQIADHGTGTVETRWQKKDGTIIDVLLSSTPVDVEEQSKGVTFTALDITERKQAEADRQKLQSRLQQTQKMESIGSLSGGIAHDFNNILFPIIGNSQLIINDFDPGSPEHKSLKAIMDAGERGRNLVRQILAIGQQSEQQPIPVQIQTVLKEVLKLIRSTIPANIHITKDIRKDCSAVKADPTQIHQIAMNLITNASHALEDDAGEIAVELKEVVLETEDFISENLEPGRYAMLTVSDTGSGMSPDIMDKLFDPYFTTKEKGKGTGLGLSVVHGIVQSYGGDIKVYSELGKGTSFHVYLPVINKTAGIAETEKNIPLPTGDERILVVDDEVSIIRLEEKLLKKLGYEVSSRTGSIDALEKFKQDPYAFDLVLTDMSMPNMTGEKLAREMIAIRPDIPMILCTGFSEWLDEKKAESIGVKAFLMKPILNRDVAETVRKVLDEAKS